MKCTAESQTLKGIWFEKFIYRYTVVLIFAVIITTFWMLCSPAFTKCLLIWVNCVEWQLTFSTLIVEPGLIHLLWVECLLIGTVITKWVTKHSIWIVRIATLNYNILKYCIINPCFMWLNLFFTQPFVLVLSYSIINKNYELLYERYNSNLCQNLIWTLYLIYCSVDESQSAMAETLW